VLHKPPDSHYVPTGTPLGAPAPGQSARHLPAGSWKTALGSSVPYRIAFAWPRLISEVSSRFENLQVPVAIGALGEPARSPSGGLRLPARGEWREALPIAHFVLAQIDDSRN
jgi:hypothetical protein